MNQVLTIASYSVLEHLRRKLLIFFGGGSVIITAVLIYLATSDDAGVIFGGGSNVAAFASLGILGTFTLLAALAVSMGNIGQPFSDGQASMILARPVGRTQYAMGRLLGSTVVVTGLCLLLAVETQVVAWVDGSTDSGLLWSHWATQTFNTWLMVAATTLFSVFISTPVLAAVAGFFFNQVVGGSLALFKLVEAGLISGFLASSIKLVWYVTPKFLSSALVSKQMEGLPSRQGGSAPNMFTENSPLFVAWATAWLIGLVLLVAWTTRRKQL